MKTLVKWMFELVITLMTIAIILPVAGSWLLQKHDFKSDISQSIEKAIGRKLHIDGKLGFKPGLKLSLFAENLRLENADWASQPSAFSAGRLEVDIALLELFKGHVAVKNLLVTDADIWIERSSSGQLNWVGRSDGQASKPMSEIFALDQITILNSRVTRRLSNQDWVVQLDQATLASEQQDEPVEVNIEGLLQKVPIRIEGQIGSWQSILSSTPSETVLQGVTANGDRIFAEGIVRDVLRWNGVDLSMRASVSRLRQLGSLFPSSPIDLRQLDATAKLVQPGSPATMQLEQISGGFSLLGVKGTAAGRVGDLASLEEIALEFEVDSKLDPEVVSIDLPDALMPTVIGSGSLSGSSDDLVLEVNNASLRSGYYKIDASGKVRKPGGDWGQGLDIAFEVDDLRGMIAELGVYAPDPGPIKGKARLTRSGEAFQIENLTATTDGEKSLLSLTADRFPVSTDDTRQLRLSGKLSGDAIFTENPSFALKPDWLELDVDVTIGSGEFGLQANRIVATRPGMELVVSGESVDIGNWENVAIPITGRLESLTDFGSLFNLELPEVGALAVSGNLGRNADGWTVDQLNATNSGSTFTATGKLHDIGPSLQTLLDIQGELPAAELQPLLRLPDVLAREFAKTGKSGVSLQLISEDSETWSINNARLASGWSGSLLTAEGNIAWFAPVDARFFITLKKAEGQRSNLISTFLPNIGLADISPKDIELKIETIIQGEEVTLGRVHGMVDTGAGRLSLDAENIGTEPLKLDATTINIEQADLSVLFPAMGIKPDNLFDADLLLDYQQDTLSIKGDGQLGLSDFTAAMDWKFIIDQPDEMTLNVNADVLDFLSLVVPPEKSTRYFAPASLVPGWTREIKSKIDLQAGELRHAIIELDNFHYGMVYEENRFTTVFGGNKDQARLDGALRILPAGESKLSIRATEVPPELLPRLEQANIFRGGSIDIDIQLEGEGDSMADLVDNGTGIIKFDIRDSSVNNKALQTIGGDLFSNVLLAINPFARQSRFDRVECGAIYLDIAEGKATTKQGLALKTGKVTVLGGGSITFPAENLSLVLAPKPRRGIGISPTSFAKMIKIGGTLSAPTIETDVEGILKSGAAIGAAIASGGLSLIAQGLFDLSQANSDVCKVARGENRLREPSRKDDSKHR